MAVRPKLLLLDEPLSNLDAKVRLRVRVEIRALQRRTGITAIYVPHDQEEAMSIGLPRRVPRRSPGRRGQTGTWWTCCFWAPAIEHTCASGTRW